MKKEKQSWSKLLLPPVALLAGAGIAVYMTGLMAHAEDNPISHFHEVTPDNRCVDGKGAGSRAAGTIFRGGAPEDVGLLYLNAHGLKTILNFQTPSEAASEQELVKQMGLADKINDIAHPMDGGMGVNKLPNGDYDNDSIISAVADMRRSANFPEYVHCTFGQDRTGMLVAFHRVFNECWSAKDAEKEWNQIEGWFHHLFHIPKHHYFHKVMKDASLHKLFEDQLEKLVPRGSQPDSTSTKLMALPMPESAMPALEPSLEPSNEPSSVPSGQPAVQPAPQPAA